MTVRFQVPQEKLPTLGQRAFLMIEDKTLALFNIENQFYAIDDSCPHQGASMFSGCLQGRTISCPAHGLRFDLASGYLLNSTQLKVTSYPIEKVGEQVFIVLNSGEQHG